MMVYNSGTIFYGWEAEIRWQRCSACDGSTGSYKVTLGTRSYALDKIPNPFNPALLKFGQNDFHRIRFTCGELCVTDG
jgi:hypothetical protein